ncbi:hypothetical protein A7U60_g5487 [Sanghuangporus baumii]|uniref:Uncharacterized protein n=1 Tax=Sanghuangporus baumii TaxID=108892 RepID=A0A9Q5N879_SANBA|nr:hypothetical protein A7U60_g5487 [Sanghuangporus baumii]
MAALPSDGGQVLFPSENAHYFKYCEHSSTASEKNFELRLAKRVYCVKSARGEPSSLVHMQSVYYCPSKNTYNRLEWALFLVLMLRRTLAATAIVFFFYILTDWSIRFLMSTVAERPTLTPTAGVGSDSNSYSREKLRNGRRSSRNNTIHEYERLHKFKKLCEDHAQLTLQVRGLLIALGDGKPAAEALTELDRSFQKLRCRETASKVLETFNELDVFDNKFFGSLKEIRKHAKVIAAKIDFEYGKRRKQDYWQQVKSECQLDSYLESVFEPLISELKTFVDGLKHIAEKGELSFQPVEARDQRDQNLTTVATFLSGVTASTLQITIVFSPMIWRQSSVYRPNLALSTLADAIFHDGPMYALTAALLTFAIGLCLLAFLVANQEGVLASAIIPVAFVGVHACSISILCAFAHNTCEELEEIGFDGDKGDIEKANLIVMTLLLYQRAIKTPPRFRINSVEETVESRR